MARKIVCKNGRSFTYLTPQEKCEKYQAELDMGFKVDHNYKPKVNAGWNIQLLTKSQRKYREDYISSYQKIIASKQSNNKGSLDCFRDIINQSIYNSRKNK